MAEATAARERPLTLRAAEVRAVLEGRKTQTRVVARIAKNGAIRLKRPYVAFARAGVGLVWRPYGGAPEQPMPPEKVSECSPVGQVGDRLWVKEDTYVAPPNFGDPIDATHRDSLGRPRLVAYAASMGGEGVRCAEDYGVRKRPSVLMPRWASRLKLEITEVRVERLADISPNDARDEGVDDYARANNLGGYWTTAFARLWDETRGRKPGRSWADNPWVWAISFRRIDPC
jgi:hypothetical protein